MKVSISVTIITKNEAKNIVACLDAAFQVADEVVVVDSLSTDGTQEICREKGAIVFEHPFEGHIQQKNVAVQKATHDYILALDADEVLSDELIASILKAKSNFTADAYQMNRLNNYCGKWIRYSGWYPDRKVRLFDRKKAHWGGKNPHDKIILATKTTIRHLKGDLLHYSYHNISDHVQRMNTYTSIMAQSDFERGKKAPLWKIILSPFFNFFKRFFLKLGFLDGFYGFIIAIMATYYSFIKYMKLRQLWDTEQNRK